MKKDYFKKQVESASETQSVGAYTFLLSLFGRTETPPKALSSSKSVSVLSLPLANVVGACEPRSTKMKKLRQHPPENCPITALLVSLPVGSGGTGLGSRAFVVCTSLLLTRFRVLMKTSVQVGQYVSAKEDRLLTESQCGRKRWKAVRSFQHSPLSCARVE